MNSSKQFFALNHRFFSTALYRYGARGNPRVFLTLSKNGNNLGDLVFELYSNHCPRTTDNFLQFATGNNSHGKSFAGSAFTSGFPGIVV